MPNDLQVFFDVLQKSGLGIFAGIFAIMFLFKKYLLDGFGTFFRKSITSWLDDQQKKIDLEYEIKDTLKDLAVAFHGIKDGILENKNAMENRTKYLEAMLQEHVAETRNFLLLIKKRESDFVNNDQIDLSQINPQYFQEGKKS